MTGKCIELPLPFKNKKEDIDSLPEIYATRQATLVAVNFDGRNVSINFDELQPGDVILSRGARPSISIGDAIVAYQKVVLAAQYPWIAEGHAHAVWTHVALLDENHQVWDAMPGLNVRARPLREVLRENGTISVRRSQIYIDPGQLSSSLLHFSNETYRIFKLETGGSLAARFVARRSRALNGDAHSTRAMPSDKSVICSTFVSSVLRHATQTGFFRELEVVVPGDFSADRMFAPVGLRWCRIADGGEASSVALK